MSRPVVLGLTLLIGVLALLALWLTPSGRGGGVDDPLEGVQPEPLEPDERPTPLPAEEPDGLVQPRAVDAAPDSESGATGAAQRSEPPDERARISGTVRVPNGFLTREVVQVRAEVYLLPGHGARQTFTTALASDGSFTFRVPKETKFARLALESRFLRLSPAVKALPGETGIVLEPLVYAAIEGEVVPPLSPSTPEPSWADMEVSWSLDPGAQASAEDCRSASLSPSHDEPVRPNHAGAFVLDFVPVGVELELHAENPLGPEWIQRIGPLAPAERRQLTIALELGITISGYVIDEHGQPVKGVKISTGQDALAGPAWGDPSRDDPRTDREGRFELVRMPRRITRISTGGSNFVLDAAATVDGTSGDVSGVVLSVVRGGCIEGTLVWPDQSPVDRFEISVFWSKGFRPKYGQAGRFRICGLGDGSYLLEARAERGDAVGRVRVPNVQPNTAPLALMLAEARAFELRGVTVDEQGAALAGCSVFATRSVSERRFESAEESADGSFVLGGLDAGEWTLGAVATGYHSYKQQIVLGESSPTPLRIVLRRSGRISGRVVGPAGLPLEGAWVGEEVNALGAEFGAPGDATDAEGRFEIQPASARARILAHKSGFAASEVRALEVGPGENVEDIVLHLREVCRVEGRVLDQHENPLPGAEVSAFGMPFVSSGVVTDARGTFELAGLPPGSVHLHASHPLQRAGAFASATVSLAPGQPCAVELRFEEADPVRVSGRITRGAAPLECTLWFRSRSFRTGGSSRSDGRFEVSLQRPGAWTGAVWLAGEQVAWQDLTQSDVRRFEVTVPAAEQHEFVLDFQTLPRLTSLEELER